LAPCRFTCIGGESNRQLTVCGALWVWSAPRLSDSFKNGEYLEKQRQLPEADSDN
jgi:hypothetical protein